MMNIFKRKLKGEEGLTLVEVLAATGILSITLLTILIMFRFNYVSNVDTMKRTIAANLARQGIESQREIKLDPENKNWDEPVYVTEGVTYTPNIDIKYNSETKIWNITVTVKWKNVVGSDQQIQFKLQRI